MITALSKYTVQNMLDRFHWGNLTEAQKISVLNAAQEQLATFVNRDTTRGDYEYDIAMDADLVFAPTGTESDSNDDYIQINIAANGTITVNTANRKNFVLSSSSGTGTDPKVYTLNFSSAATIKDITLVQPSIQELNYLKDLGNNRVTITANSGHGAFVVYIRNPKVTA